MSVTKTRVGPKCRWCGRKLAIAFELGEVADAPVADDGPASEDDVLELMKSTFDARELEE